MLPIGSCTNMSKSSGCWSGQLIVTQTPENQRSLVQDVSLDQLDPIEKMFNPVHCAGAGSACHTDYSVPLLQQEFGEVRAILAGNPGD